MTALPAQFDPIAARRRFDPESAAAPQAPAAPAPAFDPIAARRAFDPSSAGPTMDERARKRTYLGDLGAELQRGGLQAGRAYATGLLLAGEDAFDTVADLRRRERGVPMSRNMREFGRVEGVVPTLGYLAERPGVIPELIANSAASFGLTGLPMSMVGGAGGTLAGGGLGGMFFGPPGGAIGATAGGVIGTAAGAGAGSLLLNYTGELLDQLDAMGYDTADPAKLRAAFNDPNVIDTAKATAGKYGGVVALFDAVSAGVAGRLPIKGLIRKMLGETAAQATLGAGGEAAGQVAADKPLSAREIIAEGVAEIGSAPAEIAAGAVGQGRSVAEAFTGERVRTGADSFPETSPEALAEAFDRASDSNQPVGGQGVAIADTPAVPAPRGQPISAVETDVVSQRTDLSEQPVPARDVRITPEELFGLDPAPEGASPARRATLLAEAIARRPDYDPARDAGAVRRAIVDGFGVSEKKAADIVRRVRERASRGLAAVQLEQDRAAATEAGLDELLAQVRQDVQVEGRRSLAEEARRQGQIAIEDRAADPGLAYARQQAEQAVPDRPQSTEAGLAGRLRARLDEGERAELTRLQREFADELNSPIEYLGSTGGGVNPRLIEIAFKQARLYVKAGARAFADVASALVETLGDAVRGVLDAVRGRLTNDPSLTAEEKAGLVEEQAPLADTAAPQAPGPAPAARSSGLAPAPPSRPAPSGSPQGPRAASQAARPSSPNDTALGAVRQNYTAAQREILDGLVQRLGRPELAQLGESLKGRALGRAIDEYLGRPETRPVAEVQAKVDARAATPEGRADIGRRLLDDAEQGRIAGDEDTLAYKQETRRLLERAAASESDDDLQAAIAAQIAYRAIGTEQGRALAIRRERFDSPEQMSASLIKDVILDGKIADYRREKALQSNLHKAKERVKELSASDDPVGAAAAKMAVDRAQKRLDEAVAKRAERTIKLIKDVEQSSGFPLRAALAGDKDAVGRLADLRTANRVGRDIATRQNRLVSWDAAFEISTSFLLSGLHTQIVNAVSSFSHAAWETGGQRLIEALVNVGVRDPDAPQLVEFRAMLKGFLPGARDAARNWLLATQLEQPVMEEQISRARASKGLSRIDSKAGLAGDLGGSLRLATPGLTGRIVRGIGLTRLLADDEFNKGLFSNLNAYALAARQAKREGLKGAALWERAAVLHRDKASAAWLGAALETERMVFQDDPTKVTQAIRNAVREVPGLRWLFRFLRTADRVFAAGLRKSPITATLASAHDMTNGALFRLGVRADGNLEYTRAKFVRDVANNAVAYGLGALILSMAWDDDDLPVITGSSSLNYATREGQFLTAPPLSIRIGEGKWVSYSRLEPLATTLAMTVDMLNAKRDGASVGTAAIASLARQAQDKTFLTQLGDLVRMFGATYKAENDADVINAVAEFARSMAVQFVPNIIRQAARASDPLIRDQKLPPDAPFWDHARMLAYQSVPLESLAPPARVDIWGRPIRKGPFLGSPATDFAYRLLVPVEVRRTDTATGPDRLILAWNAKAPPGAELHIAPMGRDVTLPGRGLASGRSVTLDAEQYQRMATRAGTLAYDALRRMNLNWENPAERDVLVVRKVIEATREAARKEAVRDLMQGAAQR